jgi:hypothetical protein
MLVLVCGLQGSLSSQTASAATQAGQLRLLNHLGGSFDDIVIQGEYAYAIVGTELTVLDIHARARPVRIGYATIPKLRSTVRARASLRVAESYAYVITNDGGLWIADVSAPSRPIGAGSYIPPDGSIVVQVSIVGTLVYVGTSNITTSPATPQLRILDISNPAAPIEISV